MTLDAFITAESIAFAASNWWAVGASLEQQGRGLDARSQWSTTLDRRIGMESLAITSTADDADRLAVVDLPHAGGCRRMAQRQLRRLKIISNPPRKARRARAFCCPRHRP